jgi:predicted transcriptional regulator
MADDKFSDSEFDTVIDGMIEKGLITRFVENGEVKIVMTDKGEAVFRETKRQLIGDKSNLN